jgi:Actin-like ATPase involved in cell division
MSEAVPSVVAIDIGTHKVSVLIGKVHAPDNIQVIGMATARNRGMNKGKLSVSIKSLPPLKTPYKKRKIWLNVVCILRGFRFQVLN